ncbi:DUF1415 domain-containing protein [Solemya velesiana gill symbiont]|uniref:DUF1415 domain-containing protein n=1 Tax=Solemya velesiana gill symbiont TaxID=1918948 RepID=A0A1T2KSE1_9GAMM|nr:DUF1415 domain-containing protein [Solemya velesiana gill symbiont]OOZ35773.1 hypothetical protein BOW51_10350 [Solemya velesiana gill symbiont]
MTATEKQVVASIERWIREVVVALNLCPFAEPVVSAGRIFYAVSDAVDEEGIYMDLLQALDRFQQQDETSAATGFLILSEGLADYGRYNDFLELVDRLLEESGLKGVVQIAGFHPRYLFEECDESDPSNYTNRSPYPMFHLIREDDLESAVASYPDPASIPERNIKLLREMGLEEVKWRLERCCQV